MSHKENDPALEPALRDVENIQNLDTARMALRWALERMRALERRVEEVERDAKRALDSRDKTAAELDGARDLLSRRSAEAAERERYYAKIEEYLSLKLAGGLDAASLAKREARLQEREAELEKRDIEAQARVAEVRRRSEEEARRALGDAAAQSEARLKEVRAEYEKRASERDREMAERLLSAHEKEAQLASLERSLEERRRRFEEFHAAQRAALEREAKSLAQTSADQAEFLERRVEQALAAKSAAFERAWQADKQALMEELAAWRAKAREHLPALMDAQRKAAAHEDQNGRLLEENAQLRQAKGALSEELSRWRSEAQHDLPALLAAVRRAVEAEETAANLEAELAAANKRAEQLQAEIMSDEIGHEARVKELSRLEAALSGRLRDAEQALFRHYDAWLAREEELRRRDQDWRIEAEARKESVEVLRTEVTLQRDELRTVIAQYRARIEALDGKREDVLKGEGK